MRTSVILWTSWVILSNRTLSWLERQNGRGKRSFTHLSAQRTLVCVVWPLWRQRAVDANGTGVFRQPHRHCTQVSSAWTAGPLKWPAADTEGPSWDFSTSPCGAGTRGHLIKHGGAAVSTTAVKVWGEWQTIKKDAVFLYKVTTKDELNVKQQIISV